MSRDMKLIMESWNGYLTTEINLNPFKKKELKTLGDLKRFSKILQAKKKGGPVAQAATKALLGYVLPGGAEVANALPELIKTFEDAPDWISALKNLATKNDNFKTSDALSKVNVDDEISKIVDDQVEIDFLNYVVGELSKEPDDTPLEKIDMTDQLRQYLAKTFDNRTVTGDK